MEAINYFRKKLYRRSLTRFRMCLWKLIKTDWCRKRSKMSEVLSFWQSLVTQKSQIVWFFCYIRQTSLTSSSQQSKILRIRKSGPASFPRRFAIFKKCYEIFTSKHFSRCCKVVKNNWNLNFVDILGKGPDQVNLE